MKEINRLVIVSHVAHYKWGNTLYAYGPYVREIDVWADLFPQVTMAAPLRNERPPSDCLPYSRGNIEASPQFELGGDTWKDKIVQILSLPALLFGLSIAMRRADAIQVRCPGNLGLLGVILAPLFSSYRVAKYAGQWNGYEKEAWSYRLQRYLLCSKWWNAPVTVYGEWNHQPGHIIPFFTSILDGAQIERAKTSAAIKHRQHPLRVLFVGRLTPEKNVHILLKSMELLKIQEVKTECRIIGEGPMRNRLEQLAEAAGLNAEEVLIGGLPFKGVLEYYEWADVLVLASETEGWPKAIAEAMAFGLVCIGANRGLVPQMLANGRGLLVEPGDEIALASALQNIAVGNIDFTSMSQKASRWAQRYSLDGLREAIRDLLIREWHLTDDALRKI